MVRPIAAILFSKDELDIIQNKYDRIPSYLPLSVVGEMGELLVLAHSLSDVVAWLEHRIDFLVGILNCLRLHVLL